MYDFHRHAEEENQENGLVINRNEELKTFSITQAVIERNKVTIFHYDLMAQEDFSTSFTTISTALKLLLQDNALGILAFSGYLYSYLFPLGFYSMKAKSIFSLMPLIQLSKTEGLLWYQKKQFII
jgi:hypothetical protein